MTPVQLDCPPSSISTHVAGPVDGSGARDSVRRRPFRVRVSLPLRSTLSDRKLGCRSPIGARREVRATGRSFSIAAEVQTRCATQSGRPLSNVTVRAASSTSDMLDE